LRDIGILLILLDAFFIGLLADFFFIGLPYISTLYLGSFTFCADTLPALPRQV